MDFIRRFLVSIKTGPHENAFRAKLVRLERRHRRVYAKLPCFIRSRGDNAPSGIAADDARLSAQLGIVPLLDRREERIHIHMHDPAFHEAPPFFFLYSS